jgi:hypothetical protein
MIRFTNTLRLAIPAMLCLLLATPTAFAQDIPDVSAGGASPITMLDDLTSSLLADDQLATTGGAGESMSVLEDLTKDLTGTEVSNDLLETESGTNPGGPGGDPGVPVDGGLSLLLAAGAAYGVRRLRRNPSDKEMSAAKES